MKSKFLHSIAILLIGLSISMFSACNSNSEKETKEKTTFDQEAFNLQIQGVYEYLPPLQGLAALFDNQYIFIYGNSDTTMVSNAGTYISSGDTVICTIQFASNPNQIGSVFKWSAHFMENDGFNAVRFDESGNVNSEISNIRKVKVDQNTISQLKKFEGSYKYLGDRQGRGILISGYGVYLTQSSAGGGTYVHKNDTVTFKRLFSTNPDLIGAELTWVNGSMSGDTLNWSVIDESGEVLSRGQSLY